MSVNISMIKNANKRTTELLNSNKRKWKEKVAWDTIGETD